MGSSSSKKTRQTVTVPVRQGQSVMDSIENNINAAIIEKKHYNNNNVDENINMINNLKHIAIGELKNTTINVVEFNNQDNLSALWKCIKKLKQSSLLTNVLQILQNNTALLPTLIELLTTYIDIIIILIRRESLTLAASVIANEASCIALCIAIYIKVYPSKRNENNTVDKTIEKTLDGIPIIINRLKSQPPSKVPTNSLFIEIIFLKQVLTFLLPSSSSNEFYKAGGEIVGGIFKVLVGASTSGAGSNPISGIGDIIKGGTDLMKAGIKHRREMQEKMIFFAVLTIKTEVSTVIKLTTMVESNLFSLLETRLSTIYRNATNILGMKINPPVVIIVSYVQLVGKLLLHFLETVNNNNNQKEIQARFHDILELLWKGNSDAGVPGLKYFITYDVGADLIDNVPSDTKMYVSVVDDILKSRDNANPTVLLHRLVKNGQYLIDQAVKDGKEHISNCVADLLPSEDAMVELFLETSSKIIDQYQTCNDIAEKVKCISMFVSNEKSNMLSMISKFKDESNSILKVIQRINIDLRTFQDEALRPIAHELDIIKNIATSILSNFKESDLNDCLDMIKNAVLKADAAIKQIILIVDDCLSILKKLQTCVNMSRDAIIGTDDEISLYKLLENVKEIRKKDSAILLVEHAFGALKESVEKLSHSNNNDNNNDTYDSIYNELKTNVGKYDANITSTNLFTSIESKISKLNEIAKDQLASLSNKIKDVLNNQNNTLANLTSSSSSSSSLQITNSMESIVGGKENMTKIISSLSTVYESTKFFLSGSDNIAQNAKESWRVREQALWYSLQFIQSNAVVNDPNHNTKETNIEKDFLRVKDDVENLLVVRKAIESNGAIQQLLVHPETTNAVNEALSTKWEGQQDRIKREMDEQKQELDLLIKEYEKAEKEESGGEKALSLKRKYDDGKAKLKQCLTNCTNIGSQLGIVLDFLDGIQNQLFKMDAKLDQIQDTLSDMQHDLKLLVGRTFDEAVQYHIKWEKKQREKLRNEVYVPIKCWKRGDWDEDGSFHIKSDKVLGQDTYDLMEEVEAFLKKDSEKSTLLIHGLAGKLRFSMNFMYHFFDILTQKIH